MIDPDLMRQLDRWLGIPLCWVLTLLRRCRARLSPPRTARAPRRALFVLLSESGSMVLADPAVRELERDAGIEAFFLTFDHNRPALAITGTVPEERIFALRTGNLFMLLSDFWRWRRWLHEHEIDSIVDLELFSCLSSALCTLSGVRRRSGFHADPGCAGRYRGDLYTHKAAYDPAQHISLNYLTLTDTLMERQTIRNELPSPSRRLPNTMETAAAHALLRAVLPQRRSGALLLVNPNASEFLPQRRWPAAHFVALICRLLERHADLSVLLIGAHSDTATTAAIAASVSDPRCADIAGRLSLPELPVLFSLADVLVSNDSGPAHFAAVSALPVVVMFGPETPLLYRPLGHTTVLSAELACSPCVNVSNQRQTRCRDNRCMRGIPVEAVLAAVEATLAAPSTSNVVPLPLRHPPVTTPLRRDHA